MRWVAQLYTGDSNAYRRDVHRVGRSTAVEESRYTYSLAELRESATRRNESLSTHLVILSVGVVENVDRDLRVS